MMRKMYKVTAPRVVEEVPELYNAFMVAHNMTSDLREEFSSYDDKKKAIRYTDPFSEDEFEADQDFWHIPFFSIGNIDSNGIFARVSAQHTDPSKLYVAFRPMNLHGIDELLKNKQLSAVAKFTRMTPLTPSTTERSLDNLINITHAINDTTIAAGVGISASFYNLLMQASYNVMVENWFASLAKKTKANPFKTHFAKDVPLIFRHAPDTAGSEKVSIIQALAAFITYYQPREVVFTGFSYGSSLAMAAAILTKRVLQTQHFDISVFQFAGSKVCDTQGRDFALQHFKKVVYVALSRNHKTIDPVTNLPPGNNLVHVGNIYCVDVARHTIRTDDVFTTARPHTMQSLVYGFVLNQKSADTFKSIHLAGEDMLKRIFIAYMIDNNMKTPIVDLSSIPCEFFSSAGYPAKYKVCPSKHCKIESTMVNGKHKNNCVVATSF